MRQPSDTPPATSRSIADKLMEYARSSPDVLAIRGLQAALIDAAIALTNGTRSETRPTTLSEFVHAPNAVREAIGAEVVEAASQRQSTLSAAARLTSDQQQRGVDAYLGWRENTKNPASSAFGGNLHDLARRMYEAMTNAAPQERSAEASSRADGEASAAKKPGATASTPCQSGEAEPPCGAAPSVRSAGEAPLSIGDLPGAQAFIEWNRKLGHPLVEICFEAHVYEQAINIFKSLRSSAAFSPEPVAWQAKHPGESYEWFQITKEAHDEKRHGAYEYRALYAAPSALSASGTTGWEPFDDYMPPEGCTLIKADKLGLPIVLQAADGSWWIRDPLPIPNAADRGANDV